MTNQPTPPTRRISWWFITGMILILLFVLWTNHRYPSTSTTPDQRREQHRLDQLDRDRARNYIENIKPHIPNAP